MTAVLENTSTESKPGAVPTFTVTLRIPRYNPEADSEPHYEEYQVTSLATDRVLDALHQIKWEQDGSLTFRRSCAHGVCGSDAMRINGKNRLACKTLIKDVNPSKPITVEPIKGLPVEKDLIVDMEPFFQAYRDVMPFLVAKGQEPTKERLQSQADKRPVRRHHQVHPVRGVHVVLPGLLERRPVLRPRRDRQRPPVHLRQPRRRRRRPAGDPQRPRGRVALPHHLQLHRGVPARHRGHQGHPGGQAGDHHPPRLTGACLRHRRHHRRAIVAFHAPPARPRPRPRAEPPARCDGRGRRPGGLLLGAAGAGGGRAPGRAPGRSPAGSAALSPAAASATQRPPATVGGEELTRRGVIVNLRPGVPAPPAVPAASWLVADMTTGAIVAARGPHTRRLPASTLKTLTALTLIPTLPADRRVVATDADVRADGTRVGMLTGSSYTAGQLFQGLLMASGNDAAYALARVGGGTGGVPQSLAAMNARAAQLGAFDTVARDPAGLDRPGQTSSAYDLALIGRAAMQLPAFRTYVTTKTATFPGGKGPDGKARRAFVINNHNRLLYNYPGTIGIKNGYTVAARQTFIGAASRGGHTYLVTEMAGTNASWRPTAALLDWAFAHGADLAPVGRLVDPGSVSRPAAGGTTTPAPAATVEAPGRTPDPAAGGDTAAPGQAAAAARPESPAAPHPWVGVAALAAAVLLVALLAIRPRLRHRHQQQRSKSRPFA